MRSPAIAATSVLAVLLLAPLAGAEGVKGEWITDADRALAVAREAGKPVLAVAMDHG